MIGYHNASSALTLLVLLTGTSFLHLSSPKPINTPGDVTGQHRNTLPGLMASDDGERRDEERQSLEREEEDAEEELFKDVDPKTLAAVLLEALNRSQIERRKEVEEHDGLEKEIKTERGEFKKEGDYRQVRTMEGADPERDGRQELALLMATQKEKDREEEEERKKAQEEEEKLTEKVTSHTTSQIVQVKTQRQPTSPNIREGNEKDAAPQQGQTSSEQSSIEEEEQLSPEELKSLETMMKEFPRLDTATKRKGELEQNQRESRDYSNHNDIIPMNKASNLTMSKKKMKWQEETQKALYLPSFRGDKFMDDFEESKYRSNATQSKPSAEQEFMVVDEPKDEEEKEDEEVLSPEEEEAQAKAEQEEMRRQAAEAQRAKVEEEKLADIASDMLLRYMVKQNNGNKKYSLSLFNAAEDKRSDEEQEAMEEDDIDPQTIDKLIEISSKLHLPADDVVDIISDVEKKKKKDLAPEPTSQWQQALTPLSSSFSTNGFSTSQISTSQNNFPVSKQSSPAVNLRKTWFQEKMLTKSQDDWSKPAKPLLANHNLWSKPQKPLSSKQDLWFKSPKSIWTGYSSYPYIYPFYYQGKLLPDYYPIYFPPPPRPKPHYYIPKPPLSLNNILGNVDDAHTFPPKRRYHSWVQPRLRKPPASLRQKPYYTGYPLPQYPLPFQPVPIPKTHSPPRLLVISPQQKQIYYSALAPVVTRNEGYYMAGKKSDSSNSDDLEKYIQQILMRRPKMLD